MYAKKNLVIIAVLSALCSAPLITPVQLQYGSIGTPNPIPVIPAHTSVKGENSSSVPESVNFYLTTEPAPMGIADYGLGSDGAYRYNTSAFLGITQISSLITSAPASTGGPNMTIQLNVVLPFTSQTGVQLVYWLQNVMVYDTSNNQAYFVNNIWNMSTSTAKMASLGVSGYGQVHSFSGGSYYGESTSTYFHIPLPDTIQLLINSTVDSQSQPKIYFQYNYGSGWQTYDVVTFPVLTNKSLDSGLVVDGTKYNPFGTYYDSELVLGGARSGWNTTLVRSNIQLQLQFWNGHNYQQVTNAYTFGSNTLEAISNAQSSIQHYSENGTVYAQVSAGSGTLSSLYTKSQIGIATIQSSISNGIIYVQTSSSSPTGGYSFTGQTATLTLFPGTYNFYIYSTNGTQFGRSTETILAGQTRSYFVTSESIVLLNLSYSVVGGGATYHAPTLSYISDGVQKTSTLTTTPSVYYVDKGSMWSVTSTLGGSTLQERWTMNKTSSGSATTAITLDFIYYHQYLIEFNFTVVGGGTGYSSPEVTMAQFGNNISSSPGQLEWVDSGSHYAYTSLLNGSTSTERWKANSNSGSATSPGIIDPTFIHQYYVKIQPVVQSGGSVSPSSGWVNAGSILTISNSANLGWKFETWNGTGLGSYTGSANTTTLTVNGPIVENSIFYPGLTMVVKGAGSISYTFTSTSASVSSTKTVYVPVGTTVNLNARPSSFFYKMEFWSGGVTGSNPQTTLALQSPATVQVQFSLNLIVIGAIAVVILVLVAAIAAVARKRSSTAILPSFPQMIL